MLANRRINKWGLSVRTVRDADDYCDVGITAFRFFRLRVLCVEGFKARVLELGLVY